MTIELIKYGMVTFLGFKSGKLYSWALQDYCVGTSRPPTEVTRLRWAARIIVLLFDTLAFSGLPSPAVGYWAAGDVYISMTAGAARKAVNGLAVE